MADFRQMNMGINGGSENDPDAVNANGDQQYIPVDEMYPEAAAQEIPQQQKALVPVLKKPRY